MNVQIIPDLSLNEQIELAQHEADSAATRLAELEAERDEAMIADWEARQGDLFAGAEWAGGHNG
ncbi:MAG: hypothetical protein AAF512_01365 [Pseudomonadota bacterium]